MIFLIEESQTSKVSCVEGNYSWFMDYLAIEYIGAGSVLAVSSSEKVLVIMDGQHCHLFYYSDFIILLN